MKPLTKEEMESKQKDLDYIKQFRAISVSNVCKDLKLDYSNVIKGTTSIKTISKVRNELERRIKILNER